MKPILLPANQPRDRFYAGGAAISAFRNDPPAPPYSPEDWIASVTTVRGESKTGLSALPDGTLLADAITANPQAWLGDAHVKTWSSDPRLLVKLLDAGQRLPVHAHPDDTFAAAHLGTVHGKAEAWYILRGGTIHLGLREAIGVGELAALVAEQNTARLLDLLHRVEVGAGDTVVVPPGVLHAIGEGVLLVELQQPEDLSILLEWKGFELDGNRDGHLGLGFQVALQAVTRTRCEEEELTGLIRRSPGPGPVLAAAAAPFFRLDLVETGRTAINWEPGYAVVVVLEGNVVLSAATGRTGADAGATILIPAGAGPVGVVGDGRLLRCRPPAR